MKKQLIQKMNQLLDTFVGINKDELQKDILDLKLSKDDELTILLKHKYYENK
tara:strand:- start:4238 stop:4393 length:156 start_codon:yes stop_codon:yes gene_type:complete